MAFRTKKSKLIEDVDERMFYVVHPLDDAPEEKIALDQPMALGTGAKLLLYGLKAYLLLVLLLAVVRFLTLAKVL